MISNNATTLVYNSNNGDFFNYRYWNIVYCCKELFFFILLDTPSGDCVFSPDEKMIITGTSVRRDNVR